MVIYGDLLGLITSALIGLAVMIIFKFFGKLVHYEQAMILCFAILIFGQKKRVKSTENCLMRVFVAMLCDYGCFSLLRYIASIPAGVRDIQASFRRAETTTASHLFAVYLQTARRGTIESRSLRVSSVRDFLNHLSVSDTSHMHNSVKLLLSYTRL